MDELTVQVEYDAVVAAAGEAAVERVRREVESRLRTVLGVGTQVLPVPPGTLERTEFKARRVVDTREVLRT